MKKLTILLFVLTLYGCDYVPQKTFKLKTEDGSIIYLQCPVIDRDRSILTYVIDHECRIVKGDL